jgi:hypothetical protein
MSFIPDAPVISTLKGKPRHHVSLVQGSTIHDALVGGFACDPAFSRSGPAIKATLDFK